MKPRLASKDIVRHFKRELPMEKNTDPRKYLYFIICDDAIDTSNNDSRSVIYRALYDDAKVYIREYNEFMSKVDKVKYPNIKQEYRFEKATKEDMDIINEYYDKLLADISSSSTYENTIGITYTK